MKFRPVRGGLKESLEEEVKSESIMYCVSRVYDEATYGPLNSIKLDYQGYDKRINWNTWLLLINDLPAGYIDIPDFPLKLMPE